MNYSGTIKNYADAEKRFNGKEPRKLHHNTWLHRRANGIAVRLHNTDILTYHPDGSITVDVGGWLTHTTKERLNRFLADWFVWQKNSVWFLGARAYDEGTAYMYEPGMRLLPDGTALGASGETKLKAQAIDKTQRAARKYAKDFARAMVTGKVPAPGPGDCWFCAMRTDSGRTLGEAKGDSDHVISHIRSRYYVPSLLIRAIEVFPVSVVARNLVWLTWYGKDPEELASARKWDGGITERQLRSSSCRYVYRQLGFAS